MRLTGMDVEELQARRMLEDIETYRAVNGMWRQSLEHVARAWTNDVYEHVIDAIPPELSGKLEPAQVFHEILEHRWYLGQQRQSDVPLDEVIADYLENVMPTKRDEAVLLSGPADEVLAGYDDMSSRFDDEEGEDEEGLDEEGLDDTPTSNDSSTPFDR
jgi:hypothetical protein